MNNHNVPLHCPGEHQTRRRTEHRLAQVGNGAPSGGRRRSPSCSEVGELEPRRVINGFYCRVPLSRRRSSSGSRTWSSFTWIYSASGATWPACREESCPTPNASWPSPLAPPSWQWADWEYSPSPPSTHW